MNIAVVIVFPFRTLSALIYYVNHTIKNRSCHYTCDINSQYPPFLFCFICIFNMLQAACSKIFAFFQKQFYGFSPVVFHIIMTEIHERSEMGKRYRLTSQLVRCHLGDDLRCDITGSVEGMRLPLL